MLDQIPGSNCVADNVKDVAENWKTLALNTVATFKSRVHYLFCGAVLRLIQRQNQKKEKPWLQRSLGEALPEPVLQQRLVWLLVQPGELRDRIQPDRVPK
jgi:hypothetical protein